LNQVRRLRPRVLRPVPLYAFDVTPPPAAEDDERTEPAERPTVDTQPQQPLSDAPLDDPSDAELMAAHVAGDPEAFGTLVGRHRNRLWAVALRTLGDPEEAADAVQDALVSAYRAAAGFRGDAAVTTWLHRVVVNASLDRVRRRASRPTVPLSDHEGHDPAESRDAIGESETTALVMDALSRLPADQRAAVVLVHLEGFSVDEAAAILSCPSGTVKSRCARGRAKLAPMLAPLHGGPAKLAGNPRVGRDVPLASGSPDPDPGGGPNRESDRDRDRDGDRGGEE
jgi:RNA polymerase sigma-70 factor (ECF subfamily)